MAIALAFWLAAATVYAAEPASTPDQLIADLAAAARSGDTATFLSYLTADSQKAATQSERSHVALQAARDKLAAALDDKFGKADPLPTTMPPDFKSALQRISAFELMNKQAAPDGSAILRVKTTLKTPSGSATRESTFIARQENGSWKLVMNTGERIPVDAETSVYNRVIAELQSGKLTDRRSALAELATLQRSLIEATLRRQDTASAAGDGRTAPQATPTPAPTSSEIRTLSPGKPAPSGH